MFTSVTTKDKELYPHFNSRGPGNNINLNNAHFFITSL